MKWPDDKEDLFIRELPNIPTTGGMVRVHCEPRGGTRRREKGIIFEQCTFSSYIDCVMSNIKKLNKKKLLIA